MRGQADIQKIIGRRHRPINCQLDWHILAYIWCKFKANLCRNNWQQNLNTSMAWVDAQKFKKITGCRHRHQHQPMDRHLNKHILVYIWCKFEAYLC
jgi:hypothetical protein